MGGGRLAGQREHLLGDLSAEDVAVAIVDESIVDEAEQPRFVQRRFTVGY
ncbi:hypothetical protein [Nocardia sp. R7R-8]